MRERGATEEEVLSTIQEGEKFPVKFGRTGFRRNFPFDSEWMNHSYKTKQIEAYVVQEDQNWVVILVYS
jgi:hypothetical protein